MKRTMSAVALLSASFALLSAAEAQTCDRDCLIKLVDDYVAALVAHDPGKMQLSPNVVTVENTKRIKPGEGLWQTASAPPDSFVIHVPDPVAQQVGYLAVMTESQDGKQAPIEVGLRLKVEGGQITEAEHLVVRNLRETSLANLKTPRKPLVSPVEEAYRDSRSRLLFIGASYYDALDENNGALAPFADDCVRFENGLQTVRNPVARDPSQGFGLAGSLGCEAQLNTNTFEYITHIDHRRVFIADEVNGLALGFSQFRHAFEKHEFRVFGIPGQTTRKMDNQPFDLPAMHIFKIWGGKLHEIEAIGIVEPYMSPTGWE
ncbi:MAG TPA: hypothetical protein VFV10_04985 [Gammaproteobacteria bacterium]|nr:hypothetical protein [Gammaproteobacteria bacterium]